MGQLCTPCSRTTSGGSTTVLTDEQATTASLRGAIVDLQHQASDDDVVVITFSGHGSTTLELITYDRISTTCLVAPSRSPS